MSGIIAAPPERFGVVGGVVCGVVVVARKAKRMLNLPTKINCME